VLGSIGEEPKISTVKIFGSHLVLRHLGSASALSSFWIKSVSTLGEQYRDRLVKNQILYSEYL
jgi:hypothetical protein